MDKSENQSYDNFKLSKSEIIRGHDSYLRVLQNSNLIFTNFLKAFVKKDSEDKASIDFTYSPHFTSKVKVGFIIAKKRIRKSFFRNRIKRLLKESYRLNKNLTGIVNLKLEIIITLSDAGYEHFKINPDTKIVFTDAEMKILLAKIKNKYTFK